MNDLISRQAAINALGEEPEVWLDTDVEIAQRAQWRADKAAIEAVPPAEKKGRWVQYNEMWGLWECSECGAVIHSESKKDRKEYHAFCGRCGARMEE